MDPISLILSFALAHPQSALDVAKTTSAPGQVDASQLQSSTADLAMETLKCYHPTARFRSVDVLNVRWDDYAKFGATSTMILKIGMQGGFTGQPYEMVVAAMTDGRAYRTHVIDENTMAPYNKKCPLERWTAASPPTDG